MCSRETCILWRPFSADYTYQVLFVLFPSLYFIIFRDTYGETPFLNPAYILFSLLLCIVLVIPLCIRLIFLNSGLMRTPFDAVISCDDIKQ